MSEKIEENGITNIEYDIEPPSTRDAIITLILLPAFLLFVGIMDIISRVELKFAKPLTKEKK